MCGKPPQAVALVSAREDHKHRNSGSRERGGLNDRQRKEKNNGIETAQYSVVDVSAWFLGLLEKERKMLHPADMYRVFMMTSPSVLGCWRIPIQLRVCISPHMCRCKGHLPGQRNTQLLARRAPLFGKEPDALVFSILTRGTFRRPPPPARTKLAEPPRSLLLYHGCVEKQESTMNRFEREGERQE